jgi:hypothetical protein
MDDGEGDITTENPVRKKDKPAEQVTFETTPVTLWCSFWLNEMIILLATQKSSINDLFQNTKYKYETFARGSFLQSRTVFQGIVLTYIDFLVTTNIANSSMRCSCGSNGICGDATALGILMRLLPKCMRDRWMNRLLNQKSSVKFCGKNVFFAGLQTNALSFVTGKTAEDLHWLCVGKKRKPLKSDKDGSDENFEKKGKARPGKKNPKELQQLHFGEQDFARLKKAIAKEAKESSNSVDKKCWEAINVQIRGITSLAHFKSTFNKEEVLYLTGLCSKGVVPTGPHGLTFIYALLALADGLQWSATIPNVDDVPHASALGRHFLTKALIEKRDACPSVFLPATVEAINKFSNEFVLKEREVCADGYIEEILMKDRVAGGLSDTKEKKALMNYAKKFSEKFINFNPFILFKYF